ncbi:MAG: hypothetical protein PWQ42_436 [Sulfurospirillum sp.]|nr:hypothetical protein [Sulfurospirillum sp.]
MEKFIKSNVSYLKDPNFIIDEFKKRVEKTFETLKKVDSIRLDSSYLIALERYANDIINVLNYEEIDDYKALQEELLKKANLLDKEKNKTRYKKDKHKNSSFHDGY